MKEPSHSELTEKQKPSELDNCLEPLLTALNWHGNLRQLKEAIPHLCQIESVAMFCKVMDNLNYKYRQFRTHLTKIDSRLFPCLFVSDNGYPMVLLKKEAQGLLVFDGETNKKIIINLEKIDPLDLQGRIYLFKLEDLDDKPETTHWALRIFLPNKSLFASIFLFSFFISLLILAVPLFVMGVYNDVIAAASPRVLEMLLVGMSISIVGILLLFKVRAKLTGILGANIDRDIGNIVFQKLLYLPPVYTETATLGSQITRIKEFDKFREFFTGPLFATLFEVPFVLISLIVVAFIGNYLVLIPISLMVVYLLIEIYYRRLLNARMAKIGVNNTKMQEFLLETFDHVRDIKFLSAEDIWAKRFRDLSARFVYKNFIISFFAAMNNSISEFFMMASGLGVMFMGAIQIMNGKLSGGALIAVMMLTWRVLTPIKSLFDAYPKLIQMKVGFLQINRLMSLDSENVKSEVPYVQARHFKGDIEFNRVSFRYQAKYDPSLLGVSFNVKAGEMVGIVGPNGSGKSTLLKLILNMYKPQAGAVLIDHRDTRQINAIELRQSIAYQPQAAELFYGSIAQNLRLADPGASDEDLRAAAQHAGILEIILKLPQGFNTSIKDFTHLQLSNSFQHCLCLARAYLKNASIILMDEPAKGLDTYFDQKLKEALHNLHGKATLLMVTHRPSHLEMMDEIILMNQGQLLIKGPTSSILTKIPKELL